MRHDERKKSMQTTSSDSLYYVSNSLNIFLVYMDHFVCTKATMSGSLHCSCR
jgi:hypothetical protein